VNRYRIERQLGEGGMAIVYLAEDIKHRRRVALKVLRPELTAAMGSDRFLSEIRTTANLQHPNILPLFDSGEADGLLYYVMPYVDGESLRQRLEREHRLDLEEAMAIASDVAEAAGERWWRTSASPGPRRSPRANASPGRAPPWERQAT
jgi:serine/threonine-protein kinase